MTGFEARSLPRQPGPDDDLPHLILDSLIEAHGRGDAPALVRRTSDEYWNGAGGQDYCSLRTPGWLIGSFAGADCCTEERGSKYTLTRMLGRSGIYGEAYLAHSPRGEPVVLKFFKPVDLEFAPFDRGRFDAELRALLDCQGDSCVMRCFGSLVASGLHFIVT